MVDVTVIFDVVCWDEPVEGAIPPRNLTRSATRGQTATMPRAEAERLWRIGAVASPDDAEEALADRDAEDQPVPAGDDGDAVLAAMKAEDLIAYVGQFPDEAERVVRVETAGKGRSTVLDAAGDAAGA